MAEQDSVNGPVRLRRIEITNFKAIDHLVLEFPEPRMPPDPDVFAIGSSNGIGKTSILESCTFLAFAAFSAESFIERPISLGLFIRNGEKESTLKGTFSVENEEYSISVSFQRRGICKIDGALPGLERLSSWHTRNDFEKLLSSLSGVNIEPVIFPNFLYFNSYRKVQEGNPALGMLTGGERSVAPQTGGETSSSTFKLQILRAMMGQANLFENIDNKKSAEALVKLNGLVKQYAGGTIDKLRPSANNTVEFRILPTPGGDSFSFDGLSSGQKEIISTFFLIWYYTNDRPGIVLIDEPELHLNAEWHRDFLRQVFKLAPANQYIFATHSEDVFGSVPADRRILLVPDQKTDAVANKGKP
ncbi:MAG: ATP-binding protein [Magnetococcales bacterium]|nr:ATP-binding protein [Magnetococcales bacterium]